MPRIATPVRYEDKLFPLNEVKRPGFDEAINLELSLPVVDNNQYQGPGLCQGRFSLCDTQGGLIVNPPQIGKENFEENVMKYPEGELIVEFPFYKLVDYVVIYLHTWLELDYWLSSPLGIKIQLLQKGVWQTFHLHCQSIWICREDVEVPRNVRYNAIY